MRIEVTQAHIDAGKRKRSTKCPVSLAIMDALDVKRVKVGFHIQIGRPHRISLRTPEIVDGFMTAFDGNWSHGVTPFSFDLELAE